MTADDDRKPALQWLMRATTLIVVLRREPLVSDWKQFMGELEGSGAGRFLLVMVGNARLSAGQRSDLTTHLKEHGKSVAALLESDASRNTATGLSWFFPDLKVFASGELDSALNSLGLKPGERAWARHGVRGLL